MPIAVALGIVAILAIVIVQGADMLPNLALTMFEGASSFPLLAIPLFVLAGSIMNASSISRRLIALASALGMGVGKVGDRLLITRRSVSADELVVLSPADVTRAVAWVRAVPDALDRVVRATPAPLAVPDPALVRHVRLRRVVGVPGSLM